MIRERLKTACPVMIVLITAASCSFDSFRSSELPEALPADVMLSYREDGGMAPAWLRLEILADELVVEEKKTTDRRSTIKYGAVTGEEQATLYKVFRDSKFDLIENHEPGEITYDAGSSTLAILFGKNSYSVSSGDNSPLTASHSARYSAIVSAFRSFAASKEPSLKTFPVNAVILDYDPRKHHQIPDGAKTSFFSYSHSARAVEAAKNALRKSGRDELVSTGNYRLELIPFSDGKDSSIFIAGTCVEKRDKSEPGTAPPRGCSFTLFVNPREDTYRDFAFESHLPIEG